jgi:hypothetical protein
MRLKNVRVDTNHMPRCFCAPDEARFPQIASSIETVGLSNPITLDESYTLLCGHHRVMAFKLLGKEYILADILQVETIHAQIAELDKNAARDGKKGILDMDYGMQKIARRHGFVLHGKFFNIVHNPCVATALRRNENPYMSTKPRNYIGVCEV